MNNIIDFKKFVETKNLDYSIIQSVYDSIKLKLVKMNTEELKYILFNFEIDIKPFILGVLSGRI